MQLSPSQPKIELFSNSRCTVAMVTTIVRNGHISGYECGSNIILLPIPPFSNPQNKFVDKLKPPDNQFQRYTKSALFSLSFAIQMQAISKTTCRSLKFQDRDLKLWESDFFIKWHQTSFWLGVGCVVRPTRSTLENSFQSHLFHFYLKLTITIKNIHFGTPLTIISG